MAQNQSNGMAPPNVNVPTRLVGSNPHRPPFEGGDRPMRDDSRSAPGGDGDDDLDRTNLYIKGLPKDCTQVDLDDLFKEFGVINQSRVYGDGVGFVRFDEARAAAAAIDALNAQRRPGTDTLVVKYAYRKSKSPKRSFGDDFHGGNGRHGHHSHHHHHPKPSYNRNDVRTMKNTNNVYLRGLAKPYSDAELHELCDQFGEITCTRLRETGVAFVRYKNAADAARAIRELNGRQIPGGDGRLLAKLANSDPFQPKMQHPDDEPSSFRPMKFSRKTDENEFRSASRYEFSRRGPPPNNPPRMNPPRFGDSYDRHPYGGGPGPGDERVVEVQQPPVPPGGGWLAAANRGGENVEQNVGEGHRAMLDDAIVSISDQQPPPHQQMGVPQQAQANQTTATNDGSRGPVNQTAPPNVQRMSSNPITMPQAMPFNPVYFDMNGQQYMSAPVIPPFYGRSDFAFPSAPSSISSSQNLHYFPPRGGDVAQMSHTPGQAIPSAIMVNSAVPHVGSNMGMSPMSPGGNFLQFNMVRPGSQHSIQSVPSLPSASSGNIFVPSAAGGNFSGRVAPIRSNSQTVGTIAGVANPVMFPMAAPHVAMHAPIHSQAPMGPSVNLAAGIANMSLSQPGDVGQRG